MKNKHIQNRIEQCIKISELSNCPRRKFGALLLDPINNIVLIDAYNGGPRGGGELCGGSVCLRDTFQIASGQQAQIGCHHAEMNLICNAARVGRQTEKMWVICTGEPCMMCAKLIHHAGIEKVIVIKGGYAVNEGADYLTAHNVKVDFIEIEGHKDAGR